MGIFGGGQQQIDPKDDWSRYHYTDIGNRPNVTTPYGSQKWEIDRWIELPNGESYPQWRVSQDVSDWRKKAIEYGEAYEAKRNSLAGGMMDRAGREFARPVDTSGARGWDYGYNPAYAQGMDRAYAPSRQGMFAAQNYGNYATGAQRDLGNFRAAQRQDVGDIRNDAEQALYSRSTAHMDPQWDRMRKERRAELANRGLRPGDETYDQQMSEFGRGQSEAYEAARNNAVSGGGAEASRQFGMQSQARGQDLGQYLSEGQFRNAALNQQFAQMQAANQSQQALQGTEWEQRAQQAQLANQFNRDYFQAGFAKSGQDYQQAQASAAFANQLRQAQISEMMNRRAMGLNEINALASGTQVGMFSAPSFVPVSGRPVQYSQDGGGGGSPWAGLAGAAAGAGMGFLMGGPPGAAAGGGAGLFNMFA